MTSSAELRQAFLSFFEAKDTKPVNPLRRQGNNKNALRVGSRTEVSVAGNWE